MGAMQLLDGRKKSMTLSVAVMTSTACMLVGLHTGTVYIYIYIHMAYVDISYDAYVMYEIMKHIVIYIVIHFHL